MDTNGEAGMRKGCFGLFDLKFEISNPHAKRELNREWTRMDTNGEAGMPSSISNFKFEI